MKKILLSVTCLAAFCFATNAQVIQSQNFQSGMPAGWSQQKAGSVTNTGWHVSTAMGANLNTIVPAHTEYAWVDDYDNNAPTNTNTGQAHLSNDTLYSSSMNCAAYAHVFVSLDVWFQEVGYTSGPTEQATIAVSNNGGVTWTTADTIGGASNNNWRNATYDISAYAAGNANVMIAFTYNNFGYQMYGVGVDNVSVFAPSNYDMGVTAQNLPYYIGNNVAKTVSGTIHNYGSTTITSMNLKYSVNGGTPVTDALSSLSISALSNYNFTHNIAWTPTADGIYTM
ncbi:MAG: hypothetical protein ABI199_10240, partial [Bacteroidia bacterium]